MIGTTLNDAVHAVVAPFRAHGPDRRFPVLTHGATAVSRLRGWLGSALEPNVRDDVEALLRGVERLRILGNCAEQPNGVEDDGLGMLPARSWTRICFPSRVVWRCVVVASGMMGLTALSRGLGGEG